MLNIDVNGITLQVKLVDNSSVTAVKQLLRHGSLTIPMKDYAKMEKFGSFGVQLPRNDANITTQPGDVILSEGNLLVIYYATNTWNFTRLGHIINFSPEKLKQVLGKGSITVTLSLSDDEKGA